MKPSELSARLRRMANNIDRSIDNSVRPDRTRVSHELKSVLAAMTRTANTGFYVDWEGRGYTPESMNTDIAMMKEKLGEGPIYSGSSEDFSGHFFSASPNKGYPGREGGVGQVTKIRGGQTSGDMDYATDKITWTKHSDWDDVQKKLPGHRWKIPMDHPEFERSVR
ncbi:MAG: hypothetical protein E4G74_03710 [Erysipelotrichales bacterium]|nr:MAG: hypothetical protein E4G74_03710 [Erysipelotrichales bacterium]